MPKIRERDPARYRGLKASQRRRAIRILQRRYGDKCFYCKCAFEGKGQRSRTVDHRLPHSQYGDHPDPIVHGHRFVDNLVLACYACNQHKGDSEEDEFLDSKWLAGRRILIQREKQREAVRAREGRSDAGPAVGPVDARGCAADAVLAGVSS